MGNRRNSYRILRVQPEAPTGFIKLIYRTMMQHLKMHPDLGGDTEQAALLNGAYRNLTNASLRTRENRSIAQQGFSWADIGTGPLHAYRAVAKTDRYRNTNRRHYARTLFLQPDAEPVLLHAAKRWLAGRRELVKNTLLVECAHATLTDRTTRERYLALLSSCSHQDALRQLECEAVAHADLLRSSPNNPPIDGACPYCAAPNNPLGPYRRLCTRCDSPLGRPPAMDSAVDRRKACRIKRDCQAKIEFGWPAQGVNVTLIDIAPTGVRFRSPVRLHAAEAIRLQIDGVRAVAKLTHSLSSRRGFTYGGQFLSVETDLDTGIFFQASA